MKGKMIPKYVRLRFTSETWGIEGVTEVVIAAEDGVIAVIETSRTGELNSD